MDVYFRRGAAGDHGGDELRRSTGWFLDAHHFHHLAGSGADHDAGAHADLHPCADDSGASADHRDRDGRCERCRC